MQGREQGDLGCRGRGRGRGRGRSRGRGGHGRGRSTYSKSSPLPVTIRNDPHASIPPDIWNTLTYEQKNAVFVLAFRI